MKRHYGGRKLKPTALFLVFVLSVSLICNFTVFAGESFTTVYSNLFEENKTGLHSFFGGTTTRSTDVAFSGSYSLKMAGREKAWYSPRINIYSIIKENGAGTYSVHMKVYATAVDESKPWIGALIRTEKENSFSKPDVSGNNFCRLQSIKDLAAKQWRSLSGTFNVTEDDMKSCKIK